MDNNNIKEKARKIRLLLADCDGVLTDGGVYYSETGEVMKKFNIRDGMGVERLRVMAHVETGIITGETSPSVVMRAKKLQIQDLFLGVKDKPAILRQVLANKQLQADEVAYIGDDTNDVEIMSLVGLAACPADAIIFAKNAAHYICENKGGEGAFREFAELILAAKSDNQL